MSTEQPLRHWVESAVSSYFEHLEGAEAKNLYKMVLKEVHTGLLREVMRRVDGNQCRAAEALGIARGTLRKLLQEHENHAYEIDEGSSSCHNP